MDYSILLGYIENLLGKGSPRARDNYAFHCPFCNHRKQKLEIKMSTDENGQNPWECWVCNTRGRTIRSLLRQLKVPRDTAVEILRHVRKGEKVYYEENYVVKLPDEFQPLFSASHQSVIANKLRKYLYRRGLSEVDFIRYNIGYCTEGEYQGRLIIPSYDENNQLNYFVGRTYENSFIKYKNPPASRDVIIFENTINWNKPIVLVEGTFDAMAVRRNAIPILGKNIAPKLLKKIVSSNVEDIYIALDKDALKRAISFSEKFLNMGKKVYLVELDDKDPSEMGFEAFTKHIQNAQELELSGLMRYKFELL
jgi:DNA primase